MKKKCRFFTKCCLFGTTLGFTIISALLVGGFFGFKMFNEMKQRERNMRFDIFKKDLEIKRITCENEKLSKELHPTKLVFFRSTKRMTWFEANRVIFLRFLFWFLFTLWLQLPIIIIKVAQLQKGFSSSKKKKVSNHYIPWSKISLRNPSVIQDQSNSIIEKLKPNNCC